MKRGFTLIELLIVVLIIGVLSAIAIPMYQGAVDKSHWSTMLPGAKALKDAEEAIKMTNGSYTDEMANLDVTMNNTDLTFALVTPNNTADPNVIRVTNSKLNNVRLASYLDDSPMFAGQLHCEAKTGDERAERLCGKLLNGQDLTSADGYTAYLLDQEIDKVTCDHVSRSWSSSKTKCYRTTMDRCTALGMPAIAGQDQCGYTNLNGKTIGEEGICVSTQNGGCSNTVIEEGGICQSTNGGNGCKNVTIKEGGVCIVDGTAGSGGSYWGCTGGKIEPGGKCIATNAGGVGGGFSCDEGLKDGGTVICNNSRYCGAWSTYTNGSICVGNDGENGGACFASSFKNGSICYANAPNACKGYVSADQYYDATSCCCGNYCGVAPKCADRGIACDSQYMK